MVNLAVRLTTGADGVHADLLKLLRCFTVHVTKAMLML